MAFTKLTSFSKKPSDLPDVPSPSMTPDDIRSMWETPLDELLSNVQGTVDTLNATTSGSSGADNIGATGWTGAANTIQALLNWLKANKTDLTGDHKGTWQGFKPTQTDPGIQGQVDSNTAQLADIASLTFNPFSYGAKGDGIQDDTTFLQNMFNDMKTAVLNGKRAQAEIPNGYTFIITSGLMFNYNKNCILKGGGVIKVADSVSTSSPLSYMLNMTEFSNVNQYQTGGHTLRDVKFDANGRATNIIEGFGSNNYGIYYGAFERCHFMNIPQNGVGINGVSWSTSITKCRFHGVGSDQSAGNAYGTGIILAESPNGVYIGDENDFTLVAHGITGVLNSDGKVEIANNVFDTTRQSAINISGLKSISIHDNYFERVGTDGETVNVYLNAQVAGVSACIIITGSPSAWYQMAQGINIYDNTFANCSASDLIAIDNVFEFKVHTNIIQGKSSPHNSLVKLLKYGFGYSGRTGEFGARIEGNTLESYSSTNTNGLLLVNKIVDYTNLISSGTLDFSQLAVLQKIVIKDHPALDNKGFLNQLPVNLYESNFINDGSTATDGFTFSRSVINGETVYILTKTTVTRNNYINIKTKYLNRLKGRYVRVKMELANSQAGASIRFSMTDGVKTYLYLPSASQTDNTQTGNYVNMEFIFHVDPAATSLGFKLDSFCSNGQTISIKNFIISPASYELNQFAEIPMEVIGSGAPTLTPVYVGERYIDTANKKVYIATGTSSSADFQLLN